MKKSIFIGALALIGLMSCQNESNELQNEVQKQKNYKGALKTLVI